MRGQLRISTINDGQMEPWLDQFNILIPMFAKVGITLQGSWVEVQENRFGWIRTFDDDDMEASRMNVDRFHREAAWCGDVREWVSGRRRTKANGYPPA